MIVVSVVMSVISSVVMVSAGGARCVIAGVVYPSVVMIVAVV